MSLLTSHVLVSACCLQEHGGSNSGMYLTITFLERKSGRSFKLFSHIIKQSCQISEHCLIWRERGGQSIKVNNLLKVRILPFLFSKQA